MDSEQNSSNGEPSTSWKSWWQSTLSGLLSPHFIITIIIVMFWMYSLSGPFDTMQAAFQGYIDDSEKANTSKAHLNIIEAVLDSSIIISGLFTTVLGLVLGHYFGQRGQQAAETARRYAEQEKEQLADTIDSDGELVVAQLNELTGDLALSNAALEQLVDLIDSKVEGGLESIQFDPSSPIMQLFTIESSNEAEDNS